MEREIVVRLKRGDPAAFDEAFEAYRSRLFGFLLRLSRRHDVAEDLLQETWLRLATRAPVLRDDTQLSAWLFTVARNLCASYWRSRKRRPDWLREAEPSTEADVAPSPFDVAAAGELHRRIEAALARLPLPQCEALLLVGVEGFSPAEAAGIVGLNPEAFRQRLSRARARLLALLQPAAVGPVARSRPAREIQLKEV